MFHGCSSGHMAAAGRAGFPRGTPQDSLSQKLKGQLAAVPLDPPHRRKDTKGIEIDVMPQIEVGILVASRCQVSKMSSIWVLHSSPPQGSAWDIWQDVRKKSRWL